MPDRPFPPSISLVQLKKQAKDLLQGFLEGSPSAYRRFGRHHPQLRQLPSGTYPSKEIKLADAQIVLAREYGFAAWPKLKLHVQGQQKQELIIPSDPVERKELFFKEGKAGGAEHVRQLIAANPNLLGATNKHGRTLMQDLAHTSWCEGLPPSLRAVYRVLCDSGVKPDLLTAVRVDDRGSVSALLEKEPRSAHDSAGTRRTPFVAAADNGHLAILNLMLDAGTPSGDQLQAAMGRALLSSHFPVCERLLETGHDFDFELLGNCEFQNPIGLKWELDHGADPNRDEGAPLKSLLSTYSRKIGPKHECIDLLIEYGAQFLEDPVMAIHRGQADKLAEFIQEDAQWIERSVSLDYGGNLSLMDVTLFHVAVELNERECVELLLSRGADLNARAGLDDCGLGGQTPLFHAIGGNQGLVYPLFEFLLSKGPDLSVAAHIQSENHNHHKQRTEIQPLTPLGYALKFKEGPGWRESSREAEALKALGAPA